MAGKNKKKKRHSSKINDLAIAERELSKGNAKLAVKHARVAYRRDPSEPIAALLRRALLDRTQDLYARKMHAPAREVLQELNSIAGENFGYADELRRYEALLGVGDGQANAKALTSDPALLGELLDAAVRDDETTACPRELLDEVRQVRQALEAVANGQDEKAVGLLQPVGRLSPLVDWKLFVRGLIAFYNNDAERLEANWSRLASERMPYRIAQSLQSVSSSSQAPQSEEVDEQRLMKARSAFESPLTLQLRRLQAALREGGRWTSIFGAIKEEFGKSHPKIIERVAEILVAKFIETDDWDGLERLRRLKPPLGLDPRMTRAAALLHELDHDYEKALEAWTDYLDELGQSQRLNAMQRKIAIALVHLHIGQLSAAEAEAIDRERQYSFSNWSEEAIDEQVEMYRDAAYSAFAKSREYDPELRHAYSDPCQLLVVWEEFEQASGLYGEYAAKFPDNFGVQIETACFFRQTVGDPAKAQAYAQQAERLRPRDEAVARLLWDCAFDLARAAAREKQFGVARRELEQAEAYVGANRELYVLNAMRGAIALKSANDPEVEAYFQPSEAPDELAPAAALAYCGNAFQCGVSNAIRGRLNDLLQAALSHKKNTVAGGGMARYMNSLGGADVTYHGYKTHQKLVADYLKKCPKKSWGEADLVDAIHFAEKLESPLKLLAHLAKIGIKRHPENPHFPMALGAYEMSRGVERCNRRKAAQHLEHALELNKNAPFPLNPSWLQTVSDALSALRSPPRSAPIPDFELPENVDIEELLDLQDAPPELREMIEEYGFSLGEMVEAVMRGETPQEFFDRHVK